MWVRCTCSSSVGRIRGKRRFVNPRKTAPPPPLPTGTEMVVTVGMGVRDARARVTDSTILSVSLVLRVAAVLAAREADERRAGLC